MEWLLLAIAVVIAIVGFGAARGRSSSGGWRLGSREDREDRDGRSNERMWRSDEDRDRDAMTANASGSPDDRDERAGDVHRGTDASSDGDSDGNDGGDDGGGGDGGGGDDD